MRPQRFVPGFFQRSVVDIEEEIEDQKKYVQRWEKRVRDYKHKLEEIAQSRTKLRGLMGSKYNAYNRQNEKTLPNNWRKCKQSTTTLKTLCVLHAQNCKLCWVCERVLDLMQHDFQRCMP